MSKVDRERFVNDVEKLVARHMADSDSLENLATTEMDKFLQSAEARKIVAAAIKRELKDLMRDSDWIQDFVMDLPEVRNMIKGLLSKATLSID